jgi:GAT domain
MQADSVEGAIELSEGESNALLKAVVDAQRRHAPVMEDAFVRAHAQNLLEVQHHLVKLIHTVNDEEFLNKLVQANDKVIDSLQRLQLVRTSFCLTDTGCFRCSAE